MAKTLGGKLVPFLLCYIRTLLQHIKINPPAPEVEAMKNTHSPVTKGLFIYFILEDALFL